MVALVEDEEVPQLLHAGSLDLLLVLAVVVFVVTELELVPQVFHAAQAGSFGLLTETVVALEEGTRVRGEAATGLEINDKKVMSVALDPRKSDGDGMVAEKSLCCKENKGENYGWKRELVIETVLWTNIHQFFSLSHGARSVGLRHVVAP